MASSQTFTFNIKAIADMKDVLDNVQNIQTALGKLKLPNNLQTSFDKTFSSLTKEIEHYQEILNRPKKTKSDVTGLEKSGAKIISLYDQIISKIKTIDNSTLKNAFKDMGEEHVKNLRNQIDQLQTQLSNLGKSNNFANDIKSSFNQIRADLKNTGSEAEALAKKLNNSTFKRLLTNLDTGRFDLVGKNIQKIKQDINNLQDSAEKDKLKVWIEDIEKKFNTLSSSSAIQDLTNKLKTLKSQLSGSQAQFVQELINSFQKAIPTADDLGKKIKELDKNTRDATASQASYNSEMDMLKSRIQYFFGLNNAINLVKRTLRSAFNTVKQLDKAMTETAVVTDFSVGDMWAQLPEYTKRANELGITTQAAYEAATLYYQQGLKTNEVMAVSNETLKMARIAGLEAAEATDRMTNALRGFNMEITEANAQRIDDVYSRLAAISASNVDEISTAMTKVASLAHNAGAEFETTAAFLAQIIETTRESAETAGTALKTVYARFTEVKSLYNEGDLRGQDEEGEIININRVSQALRTAGIDLNKYFLGEVGIDDIFMELASKWKSLTTLQQRYIATQAAGSRQQSRFIALMSDYARTQELVGEAYNANGAAAKQFEKTQESLESKLARLKNAWNEFAMGIANNQFIKIAVDGLTGLLNLLNSLSTGFGTLNNGVGSFISSLIKLTMVIEGLKLGKGLLGISFGAIGSKLTGTQIGFKQLLAQNMGHGVLGTLISGQGAKAAGAGYIGKHLAGAGAAGVGAAGAGSLVAPLLAIAAAVGAIILGYKQWEKYTLQGQLKTAKRLAKEHQEAADTAKVAANNYKNLEENYKSLSEQINSTVDSSKRSDLIEQRNQAVLDAIKAEPSIGQYASVEKQGLEIVITIDEESFKKAANDMADTAQREERTSYAYNAQLELKALQADLARISQWDYQFRGDQEQRQTGTRTASYIEHTSFDEDAQMVVDRLLTGINDVDWGEKYPEQLLNTVNSIFTHQANAQLAAGQYYGNLLKNSPFNDDISNLIIDALGQAFITSGKIIDDEKAFYEFANQVNGNQEYQQLLNFFAGNFGDLSDEEITNFIKSLSDTESPLSQFAKLLKIDVENIREQINKNQEAENARRQVVASQLNQRFVSSTGIPSQDELILSILTNAEKVLNAGEQEGLKHYILDRDSGHLSISQEEAQEITDFFSSIDLNDPINAFDALAKASESSNQYISSTAESLLQLSKFDKGNLTQIFLTSDEYSEMSEEIQDLIEKNGELSESDIDSLSQKYKSLDILINKVKVSARSLAKTFTLIESGKISIESVTTSFLKVLDSSRTFKDILNDIAKAINDFNNINTAGKTIDSFFSLINQFGENVNEKGRLSPELAQTIFGRTFDSLEEAKAAYELLNSFAENDGLKFFTEAAARGSIDNLFDLGNGKFDWDIDNIESYSDLIEQVKNAGKAIGLDMSDALAEYMIASFYEHGDTNFRNAVDRLNSRDMFKSILDEFNNQSNKFLTAAQIEAMAAEVGLDPDTFWTQLSQYLIKQGANIKTIGEYQILGKNKTTVEDLVDYFRQSLGIEDGSLLTWEQILGDRFLKGSDREGYTLDIPNLRLAFGNLGFTDEESAYTLQKLNEILSQQLGDKYKPTSDIELNNLAIKIQSISSFTFGESVDLAKQFGDDLATLLTGVPLDNVNAIIYNLTATYANGTDLTEAQKQALITLVSSLIKTVPIQSVPVELQDISFVDSNGNVIPELYNLVRQKVEEYNTTMENGDPLLLTPKGVIQLQGMTVDPETLEKVQTLLDIYSGLYKGATLGEDNQLTLDGKVIYDFDDNLSSDQIQEFLDGDYIGFQAIITAEFAEGNLEELRGQLITSLWEVPIGGTGQELYVQARGLQEYETSPFLNSLGETIETFLKSVYTKGLDFSDDELEMVVSEINRIYFAALTAGAEENADAKSVEEAASEAAGDALVVAADAASTAGLNLGDVATAAANAVIALNGLQPTNASNASGGIIKSHLTSLTGEEAPEIVWNKKKGYSYITGQNGPEFCELQPGDQIFDAAETKKILRNSRHNSMGSFARGTGYWNPTSSSGPGGTGSNSNDNEKDEKWKNELDWLYNLVEDIAELERIQTKLQEEYDDYLKDQSKNGRDLYNLLIKQLGNLYTQLDHQTFALEQREREMREFMDTTNKYDEYLSYNWQDRTLEIDWDAIEAIQDKDTYEEIKELVSEAESIQDKMDDAEDSVQDIRNQIEELENIWRDTYVDFEERVLDAIIKSYQTVIDNYSELNDTLNNSNSEILDALQKQISLERQIRDNTKTEQDIADQEARLAFLRRDTTGSNELSALQLSSQLDESREAYEDNLIDQAIAKLQEDNDEAAAQRQKQIEIMQAQLDYQSENGEFNAAVRELLESAMDSDGKLLTDSELYRLLQSQENWQAMSEVSKQVWEEELQGTFKEVAAFILKQNAQENGTYITALTAAITGISSTIGSYSQALTKMSTGSRSSSSSSSSSGSPSSTTSTTSSDKNRTLDLEEELKDIDPKKRRTGGCFAKGTKILMANNSIKNIEDIKINNLVMAYDEEKNIFIPKKVTKSYIHHNTPSMVRITFTNNDILELTPGHPLYSTNGWKSLDIENSLYEHGTIATLLHVGDEIIGINENKIVQSIEYLNIGVNYDSYNIEVEDCHTFLANGLVAHNMKVNLTSAYATGGLASTTGLAWLDGTLSEPEYVLNARQTDAFLQLADILPSMMQNGGATNATTFGGVTLNLVMNVDQIASDYDVDRIADRVKSIIYDAGSYRNVNTLNFSR